MVVQDSLPLQLIGMFSVASVLLYFYAPFLRICYFFFYTRITYLFFLFFISILYFIFKKIFSIIYLYDLPRQKFIKLKFLKSYKINKKRFLISIKNIFLKLKILKNKPKEKIFLNNRKLCCRFNTNVTPVSDERKF